MAIFTIFKRVLEKRRIGDESTEAIYHKAKKLARDYRKVCLNILISLNKKTVQTMDLQSVHLL